MASRIQGITVEIGGDTTKLTELVRESVVANFATTAADGKTYQVDYYNLDVIISVGYRVKSKRGTQFRIKVQNKIHYAIHGQTAAEVIYTRADAEKEFMGLTTFVGNQPRMASD